MTRHSSQPGLSNHDKDVLLRLEETGWFVNKVFARDGTPNFAYSFGIYERWRAPELIIYGLDLETMHSVINLAASIIQNGARFASGDRTNDLLDGYECAFRTVDPTWYKSTFTWTSWYYEGAPFPALQIFWPDRNGRFPWEESCAENLQLLQPDLSVGHASNEHSRFRC
jgi:hypothetical protein